MLSSPSLPVLVSHRNSAAIHLLQNTPPPRMVLCVPLARAALWGTRSGVEVGWIVAVERHSRTARSKTEVVSGVSLRTPTGSFVFLHEAPAGTL